MNQGLVLSVLVVFGATQLFVAIGRPLTFRPSRLADVFILPLLGGLLVARVFWLALDAGPGSLARPGLVQIGDGVEFVPGLIAGIALCVWLAARRGFQVAYRLADLAPYFLVGYGAYEAGCLVRSGCFGPVAPVGLSVNGVAMVPVGLVVAAISIAAGVVLRFRWTLQPRAVVYVTIATVAVLRAIAGALIRADDAGATRANIASFIIVAVMVPILAGALIRWSARRRDAEALRTHLRTAE